MPLLLLALAFAIAMAMPTMAASILQNGIVITTYDETFTKEIDTYQWLTSGSIYLRVTNTKSVKENIDLSAIFPKGKVNITGIYEWKQWINVTDYETRCEEREVNGTRVENCVQIPAGSHLEWGWKPASMGKFASASADEWKASGISIGKTESKDFRIDVKVPIGSSGKFDIRTANLDSKTETLLDPWWNSSWTRKRPVIVNTTGNLANYQIAVNITYDSDMQADFDDIRFVDASETKELSYWLQSKADSSWAYFWVKGNFTTANGTQMYAYYGNPAASSTSSITSTMIFGDDFGDGLKNWTAWRNQTTSGCTITEGNGRLNISSTQTGSQACEMLTATSINFSSPIILEGLVMQDGINNTAGSNTNEYQYFGFNDVFVGTSDWCPGDCALWVALDGSSAWLDYDHLEVNNDNAATSSAIYSLTIGNYVRKTIVWNEASGTFYKNSSLYANLTTNVPTGEPLFIHLYVGTSGVPSNPPSSAWDWVFVRQYAAIEPTYSVGEEQEPNMLTVTINYPANTTYIANNITMNWTVTDGIYPTLTCWRYLDGTLKYANNVTNGTAISEFMGDVDIGSHNVSITCQNGALENATAVTYFSVLHWNETNQTYSGAAYETNLADFGITFEAAGNVANISGNLTYNNTNYSATTTKIGSTFALSATLQVPPVEANGTAKNFYWSYIVTYANGTNTSIQTTTSRSQTIYWAYYFNNVTSSLNPAGEYQTVTYIANISILGGASYANIAQVNLTWNGTNYAMYYLSNTSNYALYQRSLTMPPVTAAVNVTYNSTFRIAGGGTSRDNMSISKKQTIYPLNVTLYYLDENNLTYLANVNVWFINDTTTKYFAAQSNKSVWNFYQLPHGNNIDVMVLWGGAYRHYYINITNQSLTLNVYFVPSMYYYTFYAKAGDIFVPNALITVQLLMNTTYVTIAQGLTGQDGSTAIPLQTAIPYRIIASHPNYAPLTFTQSFNPAQSIIYINFLASGQNITAPPINRWNLRNVSVAWSPQDHIIYWQSGVTPSVNLTYNDAGDLTNRLWLNVTYHANFTRNAANYAYYDLTGQSHTISTQLNASPASYDFTLCINRTDENNTSMSSIYCATRRYIYSTITGIGLWDAASSEEAGGFSVVFWKIIAFIAIAALTAVGAMAVGALAAIITPIAIIVAALLGIFTIYEALVVIILSIVVMKFIR